MCCFVVNQWYSFRLRTGRDPRELHLPAVSTNPFPTAMKHTAYSIQHTASLLPAGMWHKNATVGVVVSYPMSTAFGSYYIGGCMPALRALSQLEVLRTYMILVPAAWTTFPPPPPPPLDHTSVPVTHFTSLSPGLFRLRLTRTRRAGAGERAR